MSKTGAELELACTLFREYAAELGENLCFQSFDRELQDPLALYGPPSGALFLAWYNGEPAGCIALKNISGDAGAVRVCEMKRLYVRPAFRAAGVGTALVDILLERAVALQYEVMKLDTLQRLQPAIALYAKKGFSETTAYYNNPIPGVVYMQKLLQPVH